ncbi:unnamed protein product [Phytophthora fragariaefolia]|uniref:Unnamed protein product n=1 Tax=Phytophthora fragariaefolia TaxID=1490495 RepID=A0A9W6Y211_9STRA|nr:unnamed protein product [Phytophthora fragariaefolia]
MRDNGIDFKSGAAAVVRNLLAAFPPESRQNWHAVVVDRFYSSVILAAEDERVRGADDPDQPLGIQQGHPV